MVLWSWLHEMREPNPEELAAIHGAGALHLRLLAALARPDLHALEALWCECDGAGSQEERCVLPAAVAVAALGAICGEGHDFRQAGVWIRRVEQLFECEAAMPAICRAGLLVQQAIIELLGECSLAKVRALMKQLAIAAEQSRSTPLFLAHAAVSAYTEIMGGHFRRADTLIGEAIPACVDAPGYIIPSVHLRAVRGLLDSLYGNTGKAQSELDSLCNAPGFDALPSQVWMLAMGHRMLALTTGGAKAPEIRAHAERIWKRAALEDNTYHRSYQYYAIGLAELAVGHADDALFYATMATELGRTCGSDVAERTAVLLSIQALVDLGRDDEAFAALANWHMRWIKKGAMLLASAGKIEEAALRLRQSRVEPARQALIEAAALLPPDELLPAHHRSRVTVDALRQRLLPMPVLATLALPSKPPVQIVAFGSLRIGVGGDCLFDRDWHGNRTKVLIKALIVLGGYKVSAERLCDLLWPDADGNKARQNLKVAISRLRRLGIREGVAAIPWIATQHGHISLVSALCSVDSIDFRHALSNCEHAGPDALVAALNLYVDDFLAGDDSEPWIVTHRDELRRLYVRGAQRLAHLELSNNGKWGAEALLERALAFVPTDERSYELLIRLHLAAGHSGIAAETYDRARAALPACGRMKPGAVLRSLLPEAR